MRVFRGAGALIFVLCCVISPAERVSGGFPVTLSLERSIPLNGNTGLEELKAWDRARHGRILQSYESGGGGGVVDFPVDGSADPFAVGLYFTRVKLGSPPKEFYVQIDSGSDILWVNCDSCNGCPTSSGLGIPLQFFNPGTSPSAKAIYCSDQVCAAAIQTAEASCSSQASQCTYQFQYGDGSGTSGYFVSDVFYFDTVIGESVTANSSAPLIFGCSNYQSGDLTKPDRAVDGILGLGQHQLSMVSQLAMKGIAPRIFSHCLKGRENGGGILVLGEIVEPGIVYSPLVPGQPHYNLNLQSIAVNGQILSIDPTVFATSRNRGTIVDSGTTLAYLAEEAYGPFVNALTASVSPTVRSFTSKGNQCFLITSSVGELFPPVSLNFEGGASLVLKPEDYLLSGGYVEGAAIWCIGFQKVDGQGITILGDLVLKDKIFVYDLTRQRLGWANYDCSLSVNVSLASGKDEFINAGQLSVSSSQLASLNQLIVVGAAALAAHLLLLVLINGLALACIKTIIV
ncbi:hypothetical protein Scep_005313 [Stephania cephalantha]|uniref:Peptidase A1 domain-containing protein n=1 Tax=Stephania cephalantha TaxID=152367 RepID=A0AAP0PY29_9MAGN